MPAFRSIVVIIILAATAIVHAEADGPDIDTLLQNSQQWIEDNVDPNVLNYLQDPNQKKILQILDNLQQQLMDANVIDLAALKPVAVAALPVLESYEETDPYAVWLKTRLDYFDAAEQFKRTVRPPAPEPNQAIKPLPNPGPELERKLWQKQIEKRPLPPRAASFVPALKPVFAAEGVPPELVWLAEVESSFNPEVRSPAGAAGLFQLMPKTAKLYGLSTWPIDQRLEPQKNASAAAKYLKYLNDKFKDWQLTLAAYNAGEGRVRNLLARYDARSFDKISTHLPAETQMYVPKVNATILRREGITLEKLNKPTQ